MKASLALLAPLVLLACVQPEKAPAPGIANPASVYCMKQGGTLEMGEEAGGTVGYCRLPDGTVIEEWAFFRANNP
ncbi:Hlx Putative hemolysin [Paracoccaceae bacterium]